MSKSVRIGSYGAMWGDTTLSAPQLIKGGNLNYLVADYLAEVTMAIMASQKMKKPTAGFATDFAKTMKKHLKELKDKNIKVVVNAGGVNVESCRQAVLDVAKGLGLDVKVGAVLGDDLQPRSDDIRASGTTEMFSGAPFPAAVSTTNAYLGAFPIAQALREGCDVVVTGRVVDSALVLGPLIKEFDWGVDDLDKLSQGTLAGHLIECGAQGTGGLFTDWKAVPDWVNIGFPIVDVEPSGDFLLTKPDGTGGLVCPATASEQLLYEIHDPGAYHVPDVACDWTEVKIVQHGENAVRVTGARGAPPTTTYKCISTYLAGFKLLSQGSVVGHEARGKARRVGETLVTRWRGMLQAAGAADFTETRIEVLGSDLEAILRISVKHPDKGALDPLVRESATASVSMAQGGMVAPGVINPIIAAFTFLLNKAEVPCSVDTSGGAKPFDIDAKGGFVQSASTRVRPVEASGAAGPVARIPLRDLCWARSGDKGDSANIGLIARKPEYLPFLRHAVTPERVRMYFQPDCKGHVERFDLPGICAMNFLLHNTLGGGGTSSLHHDPLAKCYGQRLLEMHVDAPLEWCALPLSKL